MSKLKSKWDTVEQTHIPNYGNRIGFIPRKEQDYGDGGAYPEIHVLQYPLKMGKSTTKSNTLPLQTDEQGKIKYDMVLHSGDRLVQSSIKDLLPTKVLDNDESILKPTQEEVDECAKRTKEALDKVLGGRVAYNKKHDEHRQMEYVKYTPANNTGDQNVSGASSRIIGIVEAQVDPLAPPKFKHKKLPKPPPSPPPPVLHSPPRKLTAEQQADWAIPPCISNWKNARGYTIPLDKRLANDGRGLLSVSINENFAKLSEALYIADRHAREEVKVRAEMRAQAAAREKKEKEDQLRELAQKAREELYEEDLSREDKEAYHERQEIRKEKAKQREREIKQGKSVDRDISEKIALGVARPTASKESMFDQRLFNQSAGLGSGFSSEDAYNLYDKPLFTTSSSVYRPSRAQEDDAVEGVSTNKIESMLDRAPHKGFSGADQQQDRSGPVQFEKEEDPFGFDDYMGKRGRDSPDSPVKKQRT